MVRSPKTPPALQTYRNAVGPGFAGADEPGKFRFSADAVAQLRRSPVLEATGRATARTASHYAIDHVGWPERTGLTANEPNPQGNPVFSLTLNNNTGAYEFRLFDELIHAVDNGENTALRSGWPGYNGQATPVPYLDLGSIIKFTDRDGDTVNLSGKFTMTSPTSAAGGYRPGWRVGYDRRNRRQPAHDTTSSSVRALFANLEASGIVGHDPDVPGNQAAYSPTTQWLRRRLWRAGLCPQRRRGGYRQFHHRLGFSPRTRISIPLSIAGGAGHPGCS